MDSIEGNQTFRSKIFLVLADYIKVCYYMCMIPFKAHVLENGKLEFKQYRVQQVLCFTLHTSALLYGIIVLWSMLKTTTTHADSSASSDLYRLTLFILINIGFLIFSAKCWLFRPNPYQCLLSQTFMHFDTRYIARDRVLSISFIIIMIAIQILATTASEISISIQHTKQFLSKLWEQPTIGTLLNIAIWLHSMHCQIMFQISVILSFHVSCLCMYLIGRSFKEHASIEYEIIASPNTKWQQREESLERLLENYITAKTLTKYLNKTFGMNMIIIFLSVLPTLGYGLSCLISNVASRLVDHIRTVYILGVFYAFLLMAAKGNNHVQNFTKSVFEKVWTSGILKVTSNKDNHLQKESLKQFLLITTQYVDSNCVGVGGTPFFIATYQFIGTITSAIITYTIIMLQFSDK